MGAYGTGYTGRPLGTGRSGYACGTLGTNGPRFARWALGAYGTGYAGRTLGTGRSGYTCGTLGTDGAGFTDRSLGTNGTGYAFRALRAYRTSDSVNPLGPGRTSWADRTLRACRTRRTICTAVAWCPIRAAVLFWMVTFAGIIIELEVTVPVIEAIVSVQCYPSSYSVCTISYVFSTQFDTGRQTMAFLPSPLRHRAMI